MQTTVTPQQRQAAKPHITVAVVDTNILINDVKYSLLVKPLTGLCTSPKGGKTKSFFASMRKTDQLRKREMTLHERYDIAGSPGTGGCACGRRSIVSGSSL